MKFKSILLASIIAFAPLAAFGHAAAPEDPSAKCSNHAADTKPGNTEKPKKCVGAFALILPVLAGLAISAPPHHAAKATSKASAPATPPADAPPAMVADIEPVSPPDVAVPLGNPVGAPCAPLGAGLPGLVALIGAGFVSLRRRVKCSG